MKRDASFAGRMVRRRRPAPSTYGWATREHRVVAARIVHALRRHILAQWPTATNQHNGYDVLDHGSIVTHRLRRTSVREIIGLMSSNLVKHIACLVLVAAGGEVAAIAEAHPEYQWTGVAISVLGALGNMFTEAPQAAAKMARLTAALGKAAPLAILMLCFAGCAWFTPAKTAAVEQAGVDLAVCVLNHVTEPIQQIVTDCGAATAEDVIKILDAHRAAMARGK